VVDEEGRRHFRSFGVDYGSGWSRRPPGDRAVAALCRGSSSVPGQRPQNGCHGRRKTLLWGCAPQQLAW
jgi:hypothetical protein